jgi:multidrug efflux pump subunit AcrB
MKLADTAIDNKVFTLVLTVVILGAGVMAFQGMSRLEDPEFTIKDALVVTPYPGATAFEVEEEVSDAIEIAVQKLGQLDEIESRSVPGLSTVTVTIKDKYDKTTLPQVWDELRRKVNDAQGDLPPGAGPSMVIDDFGDVYGIFFTVSSDDYSYAELKKVVDLLQRELLLVEDVAKVETFGERVEAVYVELDRDRMSQLGISPDVIVGELREKNLVADTGRVQVGSEFIAIYPTGEFNDIADFENMWLSGGSDQIYLRDVATVRRAYLEPPANFIVHDGRRSIGVGISTASGGNVVVMGQAVEQRMRELKGQVPLGIEIGIVSLQSGAVTTAIAGFVTSLWQAVLIVIIVLLFFMGMRSGLLIGFILVLTIVGSFIFLAPMGVALERISLGALIIALGMLVDNAIVIVDGMLVRMQQGAEPRDAATEVVAQSAIPLLGATLIAILAFAAIGTSQDATGEFCRSLFQVVMVSLLFSWVTAVTVTPLLGIMFLKPPAGDPGADPYATPFYNRFKGLLKGCIRFRWATVVVVLVLFAGSMWGFKFVDRSFFPSATRPQFTVDLWLPLGTDINETGDRVAEAESHIRGLDGVTHVTSLIGQGGLRFLLTYTPEKQSNSYAQLLVDVDDPARIDGLIEDIETHLTEAYPNMLAYGAKFQLGPGSTGKIQARFSGPDPDVLRELAANTVAVFQDHPNTKAVRTDWRERTKTLRPVLAEQRANLAGIGRVDVANTVREGFQGRTVGLYREGDLLLPVVLRAPDAQRNNVENINQLQIWSPSAQRMIPLRQVVESFETSWADEIVIRRDRKRTLTVFADPISGTSTALFGELRPQIEALALPAGYTLEWGGEYEDSAKAQGALVASLPMFILIMVLVTIALFNSLRQSAVIWLNVPLALIGVTVGLLATHQPFGFMALLGFLSLSGMLIKNGVVLVDEINLQGKTRDTFSAIVESAASRLRPVAMAASTTALGMIPLLFDAFFVSMAITIIAGLIFGTVLTMFVLPVLYSIFYRARPSEVSG